MYFSFQDGREHKSNFKVYFDNEWYTVEVFDLNNEIVFKIQYVIENGLVIEQREYGGNFGEDDFWTAKFFYDSSNQWERIEVPTFTTFYLEENEEIPSYSTAEFDVYTKEYRDESLVIKPGYFMDFAIWSEEVQIETIRTTSQLIERYTYRDGEEVIAIVSLIFNDDSIIEYEVIRYQLESPSGESPFIKKWEFHY